MPAPSSRPDRLLIADDGDDAHKTLSRRELDLLRLLRATCQAEPRDGRTMLAERLAIAAQTPALFLIGLDGLKSVNHSYGYGAGDRVVAEIGRRLQVLAGDAGLAAPIGGDEFGILLDRHLSQSAAASFAQDILREISRPVRAGGEDICISAGIGIVLDPRGSPDDIFRDAALAAHRAWELGANRWRFFDAGLRSRDRLRMDLIADLRRAAGAGQLAVFYQPKVNLRTRRTTGFEALMRWRHPRRGLILPGEFISIAEETGLIVPLGEWILRESCRQLRVWQERFPMTPPLTMNVNLSVKQLSDPQFPERVQSILRETGILPGTLYLELTETTPIDGMETSREVLGCLRALQVRLKLDDFGTGYSSLACLGAVQFDSLKIDRSFISKMMVNTDAHAIVDSVVRLAHALDMTVVAEGIEEERQRSELVRLGCEIGQGYLFSRPVPAEEAEARLAGLIPCAV